MSLLIAGGLTLGTAIAAGGWVVGVYNDLVHGKQAVLTQWSNVKTEYQRRADLFYNLAQSVKSYAKHEKITLTQVIAARSGKFGGKDIQAEMKKMKGLERVFSRLMLLTEQYPNLKADRHYSELMEEIRVTEDRVNIARSDYNEVVREFNSYVLEFPRNIISKHFKYVEQPYFDDEKSTPQGKAGKSPKMAI